MAILVRSGTGLEDLGLSSVSFRPGLAKSVIFGRFFLQNFGLIRTFLIFWSKMVILGSKWDHFRPDPRLIWLKLESGRNILFLFLRLNLGLKNEPWLGSSKIYDFLRS